MWSLIFLIEENLDDNLLCNQQEQTLKLYCYTIIIVEMQAFENLVGWELMKNIAAERAFCPPSRCKEKSLLCIGGEKLKFQPKLKGKGTMDLHWKRQDT